MEFKILGNKVRLEIVILSMLIGSFISLNLFCTCSGGSKNVLKNVKKILLDNKEMFYSGLIPKTEEYSSNNKNSYDPFFNLQHNIEKNNNFPDESMNIFAGTKSSLDCCPSHYSTKDGCLCNTPEQMKYLSSRGNNHK